jgi:TonB family protein
MEFLGLSNEQQTAIRDWAMQMKAASESAPATTENIGAREIGVRVSSFRGSGPRRPVRRQRRRRLLIPLLIAVLVLLGVFWWRWNRGWQELESGLAGRAATGEQPKAHVPAEEIERLLIHRVEPQYPQSARGTGLQGVIALDVVVGRDGSVLALKPLNGPDVLARSAMDALRWWKFEPYKVNGEPVVVETTLAVEFKP